LRAIRSIANGTATTRTGGRLLEYQQNVAARAEAWLGQPQRRDEQGKRGGEACFGSPLGVQGLKRSASHFFAAAWSSTLMRV
jgi:hypothetical protein